MPQSAKLNESVKLCSHLKTCYTNIERITRHFPEYFNESSEVNDVNEHGNIEEDINTDHDATLNSDHQSNIHTPLGNTGSHWAKYLIQYSNAVHILQLVQ